jgi:hypothetical protein
MLSTLSLISLRRSRERRFGLSLRLVSLGHLLAQSDG